MKLLTLILSLLIVITASTAAFAKDVQVKEYTRKDGTVVKGHTRQTKEKSVETTEVKGYTKKNGTVVKPYARKKAQKASQK